MVSSVSVRQHEPNKWLVRTDELALFVEGPRTTVLTACCLAQVAQLWALRLDAPEEACCDACGGRTGLTFDPMLGTTASPAKLERLLSVMLESKLDPLSLLVQVSSLTLEVEALQASTAS